MSEGAILAARIYTATALLLATASVACVGWLVLDCLVRRARRRAGIASDWRDS